MVKQHGEGEDGAATDDEKAMLDKTFESGVSLARGHRRVCLECFAPEGTPIQVMMSWNTKQFTRIRTEIHALLAAYPFLPPPSWSGENPA